MTKGSGMKTGRRRSTISSVRRFLDWRDTGSCGCTKLVDPIPYRKDSTSTALCDKLVWAIRAPRRPSPGRRGSNALPLEECS